LYFKAIILKKNQVILKNLKKSEIKSRIIAILIMINLN